MPNTPATRAINIAAEDRDILAEVKRKIPTASPRVVVRLLLELVDRDELKAALLKEQVELAAEYARTGRVSDTRGLSSADWLRLSKGEALPSAWLP